MREIVFHLRALDEELVQAWRHHFADLPVFRPDKADIFATSADAVVSPANSFGDMTGGIDRVISERFGPGLQARLQERIHNEHEGELLVGQALIVPTEEDKIPHLISAPTMRVPLRIAETVNAYLAFRAVLRAIRDHNRLFDANQVTRPIRSVLCPGLGTGTGEVPPEVCARQMRAAYNVCVLGEGGQYTHLNDALVEHYRLTRVDT